MYSKIKTLVFFLGFLVLPGVTHAASFYFSPSTLYLAPGQSAVVALKVASADQALNAVSGTITSSENFSINSLSKAPSLVNFWTQEPSIANDEASFEGVVLNPGYKGSGATVLSFTVVAKKAGTGNLTFSTGAILANDGQGTNILETLPSLPIVVTSPDAKPVSSPAPQPTSLAEQATPPSALSIASVTHPDQNSWYSAEKAIFTWTNPSGATAVRLGYGRSPETRTQVLYRPAVNKKTLELKEAGVLYFVAQVQVAGVWSGVTRYRVQIDSDPPSTTSLKFITRSDSSVDVVFESSDDLSGIDYYELSVGSSTPVRVSADGAGKPYPLSALSTGFGTSTLRIVAYDKAGNVSESRADFYLAAPALEIKPAESDAVEHAAPSPSPYSYIFSKGWLVINYLSAFLIVVSAAGFLCFGVWYLWYRAHIYRRKLLRHIAKADQTLYPELVSLRKTLKTEVESLKKISSARQLTVEESRIIKRFSTLLNRLEKIIN